MTSDAPTTLEQTPQQPERSGGVSRRALLTAGIGSAVALAAGSGIAVLTEPGGGPPRSVQPLWSELAYRSFGVVAHPTFQTTAYRYAAQWVDALAGMGAHYLRGSYADHLPLVGTTVDAARARGLRWGMLVCNDLATPTDIVQRRVADIARNAADLCLFVEGVNEPNYSRNGARVPPDWAQRAVTLQQAVHDAVRSWSELDHVTVIGPSLQTDIATPADYDRLASLGLADLMDAVGLHSYPGGRYPSARLDRRLAPLRAHFPDTDVWLTETGYSNAVDHGPGGANTVPEDVSAAYAPATVLEAVDRGMAVAWYEALDDPDPGPKDVVESNYGLVAVGDSGDPSTWRPKPAVKALTDFLAELRDPGPTYQPPSVQLAVTSRTSDVRWTALAKRDGSTYLHLRRAADVWDVVSQQPVTVDAVPVTIVTPQGRRTVHVGSEVLTVRV